jgi:hypothetical protein
MFVAVCSRAEASRRHKGGPTKSPAGGTPPLVARRRHRLRAATSLVSDQAATILTLTARHEIA